MFGLQALLERRARRARRAGHARERQASRRGPRRGAPRDRGGRAGGGDDHADEGRDARPGGERGGRLAASLPARGVLRNHPVQLSGDDPAVVRAAGHRGRQHVRAEALAADPADREPPGRAVCGGRLPRWRVERRPRGATGGRGTDRPPADPGGVLRGLRSGRPQGLRALGVARQAGPGARRRQEPSGGDAGRRARSRGAGRVRLRLLQRRPALPGGLGGGRGGRDRRRAGRRDLADGPRGASRARRRAGHGRRQHDHPGHHPRGARADRRLHRARRAGGRHALRGRAPAGRGRADSSSGRPCSTGSLPR